MVRVNKKIIIVTLSVLVLVMVIGYAAFSSNLKINGTANIVSKWSIEFTQIKTKSKVGGVQEVSSPQATGTTATFNVSFQSPGDKIIYEVTLENKGTLDAIINNISANEKGSGAIYFEVLGIKKGDTLLATKTTTFTVEIGYNENVTTQPDLISNTLTLDITYVQYVGQSITAEPTIITNQYGIVSNGLMGYYDVVTKANATTWDDLGPFSNHGTVSGATLGSNYYSFDGNDCILLNDVVYPHFTLEAVFMNNDSTGKNQDIVSNFDNAAGYALMTHANNLSLGIYASSGHWLFYDSIKLSTNKIYTASITYDGSKSIMCLNGTCQTQTIPESIVYPTVNKRMAIGCYTFSSNYSKSEYFNGKIYRVRIYNRALLQEEVLNNQAKDIKDFSIN